MAKLNISNNKKALPILKSFKASEPLLEVSCNLSSNILMNTTYYFDGSSTFPILGNRVFTDINGQIPYNNIKKFLQFNVDNNTKYFYKLEGNKIISIDTCNIINFKEITILDQTGQLICEEGAFFPNDLTDDAETFYHNGIGEFPNEGDKIFLTENRFDPLINFEGLFNILRGTYYYLYTDNLGKVVKIKTCKEIITVPTKSTSLKPLKKNNELYNIFICKEPSVNFERVYYKSLNDSLPEEGSKIYSDSNLTNLITKSSYFVSRNRISKNEEIITALLLDENGEASYQECTRQVIIEEPEEPEEPETGSFYFNVLLVDNFCDSPDSSVSFTRIYYEDSLETGNNFVMPNSGTKVFLDEELTIPYNSITNGTYGYLYKDFSANTFVYAQFLNDEVVGTRTCSDLPDTEDPGGGVIGIFG